jgi:hypothetical protein
MIGDLLSLLTAMLASLRFAQREVVLSMMEVALIKQLLSVKEHEMAYFMLVVVGELLDA